MTFDGTSTGTLSELSALKAKNAKKREGEPSAPLVPSSSRGRKRLARILEAATELFLRDGYFGTSIEAVLEASGGSKATLYSYFSTKDDLFRAVIDEAIRNQHQPRLEDRADPRKALAEFAVQVVEIMASPRHGALLRLTLGERDRFPDLAERWYEVAALQSRSTLGTFFRNLERQGLLKSGTAETATADFLGLTVRQWWLEAILFGAERLPSRDAIRATAERAADRLLMPPITG